MMKRFATILAAFGLLSGMAFAQTCLHDQYGGDPNCTANDINVSDFVVAITAVSEACDNGTPGYATVDVEITVPFKNASARYDLGGFVAADGGNAETGNCNRDYLHSGDVGAANDDGDTCLDVDDDNAVIVLSDAVVKCGTSSGGSAPTSVGVCIAWDNNDNTTCSGVDDLKAGTPSKCYCTTANFNLPLPVELVSFTGDVSGSSVSLRWLTASESNNAGFSIEHSTRGSSFSELGFVTGAGNSVTEKAYAYAVDGLAPGQHRFRLKQIDFDGAFRYSPEVEVTVAVPGKYVLEPAYPNPFNPQTSITFLVAESAPVTVALYNPLGRQVQVLYQGTPQANQANVVRVDGSALPSGTYIVRIEGNNFFGTQQVVLLK